MKFTLFPLSTNNRSGIILLVALWIIAILSLLAIGLGRRTGIDLSLTKNAVGKVKSVALARAGIFYALSQLQADTLNETSSKFDTLYYCGIALERERTPENIFKKIPLAESYFDISYSLSDPANGTKKIYYGLQDEERRIDLNAINQQSYKVLNNLLDLLGVDAESAMTIASAVADWQDADAVVSNSPYGAEDDYYMSLSKPYHCKNKPFDSVEELLLVKGMTPGIFLQLKNHVTVFPKETGIFLLNIDTIPEILLRALARSVTGPMTNTGFDDADSMTNKIIVYRSGDDGAEYTSDDRPIDFNQISLNEKEKVIFLAIKGYTTNVSRYFRIQAKGTDAASGITSRIEAVVFRDDLSVIDWHKN